MMKQVEPHKVAMWQFFNENVSATAPVHLGPFDDLDRDTRQAAVLFIEALNGRDSILDLGCGTGLPGLHAPRHAGELVGVDAAPNMVEAARRNAAGLGLTNATFFVADAQELAFRDQQFDAASMLRLLESLDWPGVHAAMAEVRCVLKAGRRVAILDKDWRPVAQQGRRRSIHIRCHENGPVVQVVERPRQPALERDTRYLFDPHSSTGSMLLEELGGRDRVPTTIEPADLNDTDLIDAWYDEGAQVDERSLRELVRFYDFCEARLRTLRLWNQGVLSLTARWRG
jgi:SAM-dependent methyltransferase